MPGARYKRYIEPDSTDDIPRSTLYHRRKRERQENHVRTNAENSQLVDNSVDQQNQEILSSLNEIESQERLRILNENENILLNEQMEAVIDNNRNTDLNDGLHNNVLLDTSARDRRLNTDECINEENGSFENNEELLDTNYDSHDEIFPDETDLPDDTDNLNDENMNDENEDNTNYDRFLNTKLCPCTNTTRGEALMMVLLISQKHCLTWVATLDVIHMINKLYNCDQLPSSKYGLFKYFPLSEETMKFHLFCPKCQRYLVERDNLRVRNRITCSSCHHDIDEANISSFFVMLNVKSRIRNLLENKHIRNQLRSYMRRRVDDDTLEDILDGNTYKTSLAGRSRWDLSYIFNTDGCQPSKSSKTSIWPIYIMLNELPPKIRSKHMILAGLWVHKKEPNMNTFLRPFVDEANSLMRDGVEWNLNNDVVVSKIYPVCCSVDSIARPHILNMKRFNGHFGCNFCEHPTEGVDGYRRFTMSTTIHPDRTDASIRLRMENAIHENIDPDINMGIKGPSVLMNLEGFDLAKGMVPDYMHSVLLGVTRQYTEIILSSPQQPYYVGSPNDLVVINSRLTSIQPPTCITRSPRSLEERNYWKASEWRSWLIWYMMICLRNVLPMKYLKHLGLLVGAIHLLIQESVTREMIIVSYEMLVKFVTKFQEYFGKSCMTFNVHLLLHLSQSVFNWGPLWTHSTFPFENENRLVLQLKTSPHLIAVQVAKRYSFYKNLPMNLEKFEKSNRFIEFCEIMFSNKFKFFLQIKHSTLIGSGKNYTFTNQEENCYGRAMECTVYQKLICHGFRFTSEVYKRMNRCNDSVIVTQNGTKGIITNICCCDVEENNQTKTEIVIFYRKIIESTRPYLVIDDINLNHIKECIIDGPLEMCHPDFIKGHCILMCTNNKYFISEIPKGCLSD